MLATKDDSNCNTDLVKIIEIPSGSSKNEIFNKIDEISSNHTELFALNISSDNPLQHDEILRRILSNCKKNQGEEHFQPLVVQFMSNDGKNVKKYYRNEEDENYKDMNSNSSDAFPQFYSKWFQNDFFINLNSNIINDSIINDAVNLKDPTCIKLLQIFNSSEDLKQKLILKCASDGSARQLRVALELSSNFKNGKIDEKVYKLISTEFSDTSIIQAAVKAQNLENVKFLTEFFGSYLQKLPQKHKTDVINQANDDENYEIIHNLLSWTNFPFPLELQCDDEKLTNLRHLRENFHQAIATGNVVEIKKMLKNFQLTKIAYNFNNQSALKTALIAKQIEIYSFLCSENFQSGDDENLEAIVKKLIPSDKDRLRDANRMNRIGVADQSILILNAKSSLHNRNMDDENYKKCCADIRKFYNELYDIPRARILLEIASQCPLLKIIFDFDNEHVSSINPKESDTTLGVVCQGINVLFIGAGRSKFNSRYKSLNDKEMWQIAKGLLNCPFLTVFKKLFQIKKEN